MKIILVVIVFIWLKMWELIKYVGSLIRDIWLKYWAPVVGSILVIIGLILFIYIWAKLIILQIDLFNINGLIVIISNGFIFLGTAKFIHYVYKYWSYEVKPFIKGNWERANNIVDKVWK